MYEYINEKALLFSNNYEITDLNVEIEKVILNMKIINIEQV